MQQLIKVYSSRNLFKISNLQGRLPTGNEDCKVFPALVTHLNLLLDHFVYGYFQNRLCCCLCILIVIISIICLDLPADSAYLVVGQVELLDLLVGDALGENVDALVCEDVVGEVEQAEVGQFVHSLKYKYKTKICNFFRW